MKKIFAILLLTLILFVGFTRSTYALSEDQSAAINQQDILFSVHWTWHGG